MSLKEVLAENLKSLMASTPGLARLPDITKATGGRLSNGKLDRIRRAASSTDIETLEELAAVFHVSPWELLKEPVGNEPRIKSRWPFGAAVTREQIESIDPDDMKLVIDLLKRAVVNAPAADKPPAPKPKESVASKLSKVVKPIPGRSPGDKKDVPNKRGRDAI